MGRKNIYTCTTCGNKFVTVDRVVGTTPFLVACVANGCIGLCQSAFYNVSQTLTPEYEWYAPNAEESKGLSPEGQLHVRMGGLLMRKI